MNDTNRAGLSIRPSTRLHCQYWTLVFDQNPSDGSFLIRAELRTPSPIACLGSEASVKSFMLILFPIISTRHRFFLSVCFGSEFRLNFVSLNPTDKLYITCRSYYCSDTKHYIKRCALLTLWRSFAEFLLIFIRNYNLLIMNGNSRLHSEDNYHLPSFRLHLEVCERFFALTYRIIARTSVKVNSQIFEY